MSKKEDSFIPEFLWIEVSIPAEMPILLPKKENEREQRGIEIVDIFGSDD